MIDNLYQSLLPSFVISLIAGAYPLLPVKKNSQWQLSNSRKIHILPIAWLLAFTSILTLVFLERFSNLGKFYKKNLVSNVGMQVIMFTGILLTYILYFSSFKNLQNVQKFIENLAKIDEVLKVLGGEFRYKSAFVLQFLVIFAGLALVGVVTVVQRQGMLSNASAANGSVISDRTFFCFIFPVALIFTCDTIFIFFVLLLYERFRMVNSQLLQFKRKFQTQNFEKNVVFYTKSNVKLKNVEFLDKLSSLMRIHDQLCDLGSSLNETVGFPMLATVTQQFTLTMFGFFNCYWIINDRFLTALCWLYWGVLMIYELFLKSFACHVVYVESEGTNAAVNKLLLTPWETKIQKKLKVFALQLTHREIKFTACGLFEINANFIYTIVGSTATYMIILIQFHVASAPVNCVFDFDANGTLIAY